MALELKSHFQNYQISLNSGSTLRFSIGIHTGKFQNIHTYTHKYTCTYTYTYTCIRNAHLFES